MHSAEFIKEWNDNSYRMYQETEKRAADKAKEDYARHPDLMVIWNPGMDTGLLYSIDRWRPDGTCDECTNPSEGAYAIAGDHNSPCVCEKHLTENNQADDNKNGIKNVLKLVTLPYKHSYPDAEESKELEN